MTEQTLQRLAEGKSLGGRPDKIDQSYVDKANEWLDKELWKGANGVIPTVEGLADYLDIARVQMYEAPELKYTLERLQRRQADLVMARGLDNTFNATIAKLILSAKHGYVERNATDITSNGQSINSEPSQAMAASFAEFAKQQTIEGELVEPSKLEATTDQA